MKKLFKSHKTYYLYNPGTLRYERVCRIARPADWSPPFSTGNSVRRNRTQIAMHLVNLRWNLSYVRGTPIAEKYRVLFSK